MQHRELGHTRFRKAALLDEPPPLEGRYPWTIERRQRTQDIHWIQVIRVQRQEGAIADERLGSKHGAGGAIGRDGS